MYRRLLPIAEQVIVITGASSGIGLVTARRAASKGARVVLAARNQAALDHAVAEIRKDGGRAVAVVADVADPEAVERIADGAIAAFGQIDTWVNNAAVSMYGLLIDMDIQDMRRQFDVNYWGQVYGSLCAVRRMHERGGAIVNVASALADRAIPLQGTYCAAKHALKAFTDSLRMELEEERAPISLTLLKPGSIDTPFFQKSRNYLDVEPQPVPPVYAPEVCAEAILHCATHPVRDLVVGGMGRIISLAQTLSPRLTDLYMEARTFQAQLTRQPVRPGRSDNLYLPVADDGGERGSTWRGRDRESSLYTRMAMHRGATAAVVAVVVAGAVGLVWGL